MKHIKSVSKRFAASVQALLLVAALAAWAAIPAAAQTGTVPDMTQFGYPRVAGTATFTPGQATTVTAGSQTVQLPADFISKTVKFELLEGDAQFFVPSLGDDKDKQVVAAFAFRVTDPATGNLVGRFDKPVQWSITSPQIGSLSEIYNTTAANPPVIIANAAPGTVQGDTLSHPFGGSGVGWLVLSPAAAPVVPDATPTAATAAPTSVAGGEATPEPVPTVVGMPSTGAADSTTPGLLALLGMSLLMAGWAVRRSKLGSKR